jgi:hypothetical protein
MTMPSRKKPVSKKKVKLRELPKAKKELTERQARAVKGGFLPLGKAGLDED